MVRTASTFEARVREADLAVRQVLLRRRSTMAFSRRPLEPEVLQALFEAARWAPSSYNEQPWRFIVGLRGGETWELLESTLVSGNRRWANDAPVLILSVAKRAFSHSGRPNRHALHDVGMATGNLIMQATELGLATHAMAGFDTQKARHLFSIPNDYEPVTMIAVGYPGDPASLPEDLHARESSSRSRKSLDEIVFEDKWGQAAAFPA